MATTSPAIKGRSGEGDYDDGIRLLGVSAQPRERASVGWARSTCLDEAVEIADVESDAASAGKHTTADVALARELVEDIYAD